MNRNLLILFTLLQFPAGAAFAQEEKINSDRPGETQSPDVAGKGYLQVEIGRQRERQGSETAYQHPQATLKYGLSRRVEVRADLTAETVRQQVGAKDRFGLKPVAAGLKASLLEERGALPALTLYTLVGIPAWASRDHRAANLLPTCRLLFENKLAKKLELDYNIGAEWDGVRAHPQWMYSVAPEWWIGAKWEAFVEAFGFVGKGQAPQHHVDGGFSYYPTDHLKLDVSGGPGLSHNASGYFVSVGVSFRVKP